MVLTAESLVSAWPMRVSLLFVAAVLTTYGLQLWLAGRQARAVRTHRDAVPREFEGRVSIDAHRKAADYTVAKLKLGIVDGFVGWVLVLGFTLFGGLDALYRVWLAALGPGLIAQIALLASVGVISGLVQLPFSWVRTFRIEQRFGFNRMTPQLWWADLFKGVGIAAVVGLPLIAVILWLMHAAGSAWWWWAWLVWIGFQMLVLVLFPTVIAPLFNKFSPLTDEALKARIEALMQRCGFRARGLFVMDGSKRSAHGNAYFTGFGAAKRIVFFDTLIDRLAPTEIEAVLAHELGHFKRRHIWKRMAWSFAISLATFALLGWLATQTWFYLGLGATPQIGAPNDALALALFFLALPAFTFPFSPISSWTSRKHEFEADAFAASQADAHALVAALVKLYEDNASTLTPDPVYSSFYYSHPPAAQRIGRLQHAG